MKNNFEAKHIKESKKALSQDLNIAQRQLNNYKEIQKELLKKPSLWQKVLTLFEKYFK
jgi:FtsZ-binding cell division protein ZapB